MSPRRIGAITEEQVRLLDASLNPDKQRKDYQKERQEILAAGGWICRNCGAPNTKRTKTCACGVKKGAPMRVDPGPRVLVNHEEIERQWRMRAERREAGLPDVVYGPEGETYGPRRESEEERLDRRKAERAANDARWLSQIPKKLEGFGSDVSDSCDMGAHERCSHRECECGCHEASIAKICSCGKEFTQAQWDELQDLGAQVTEEGGFRYVTNMKNCSCGSTLATESIERM